MEETTKGEKTKNRIIECAALLFLKNGYNNTGIKEILEKTKLPKGSFYYHFKNKEQLAIEVAEYFRNIMADWILRTAKDKKWNEFVDNFVGDIINSAKKNNYYGCPFAVLGCEMAFIEPNILNHYSNPLKNLIKVFSHILRNSNVCEDEIDKKAEKAVALFEGYVMYYRVTKDINILETMKVELKEI